MKLLFSFFMATMLTLLYANEVVGHVVDVKGIVKVSSDGSIKKRNLAVGEELKEKDLVTTLKDATVVIALVDASKIVLDESSSVHFASVKEAKQESGKVYYKITSRNASNALAVKTPFAIIGIKGTTFIVNADANNSGVKLQEGLIGVASIKEEFELYRKQVMAEFNKFVAEQNAGFEEYKQAQTQGFAEITRAFDLQANNSISFDGNKVTESTFTAEDEAEFQKFEALLR